MKADEAYDSELWPPLNFSCASQAVAWADGFLLGVGDRNLSQLGADVRKRNRNATPPNVDKNGGLITRERLQDLAETISVSLSAVKNPQGVFYRRIYGRNNTFLNAADQLAHLVWDGPGPRRKRSIAKMRAIAVLAIEDLRKRERGHGRITRTAMARNIGVSRDHFNDNWKSYLDQMQNIMDDWLEIADRDLTLQLEENGVL